MIFVSFGFRRYGGSSGSKSAFSSAQEPVDPDLLEPPTCKDCCSVGLALIFFLSLGASLFTVGILFSKSISGLGGFDQVISNWHEDILIDVTVVPSNESCPSLYSEVLIQYTWPGIQSGCLCTASDGTPQICPNSGNIHQDVCQGIQVPGVNSQTLNIWGVNSSTTNNQQSGQQSSILPFKVCGQRLQGLNYLNSIPQIPYCQTGQKSCGAAQPNTLYCVNADQPCPIQGLLFSDNLTANEALIYSEWIPLPGAKNLRLYIARNQAMLPLSEFRVTRGAGVCMNSAQDNIEQGESYYPLLLGGGQYCSQIDTRYVSLNTSISEYEYFTINGLDSIIWQIPMYQLQNTSYYQAYARSYLVIGMQCRSHLSQFEIFYDKSQNMSDAMHSLMILCLIVGSYMIFIELPFIFRYMKAPFLVIFLKPSCWSILRGIVKLVLMTILTIYLPQQFLIIKQYNFANLAIQQNCLDNQTEQVFAQIFSQSQSSASKALIAFTILFWICEPNLTYVWYFSIRYLYLAIKRLSNYCSECCKRCKKTIPPSNIQRESQDRAIELRRIDLGNHLDLAASGALQDIGHNQDSHAILPALQNHSNQHIPHRPTLISIAGRRIVRGPSLRNNAAGSNSSLGNGNGARGDLFRENDRMTDIDINDFKQRDSEIDILQAPQVQRLPQPPQHRTSVLVHQQVIFEENILNEQEQHQTIIIRSHQNHHDEDNNQIQSLASLRLPNSQQFVPN